MIQSLTNDSRAYAASSSSLSRSARIRLAVALLIRSKWKGGEGKREGGKPFSRGSHHIPSCSSKAHCRMLVVYAQDKDKVNFEDNFRTVMSYVIKTEIKLNKNNT